MTGELDKFLPIERVCTITGVHRSTIFRWEQAGRFPRRIRIGGRVMWSLREIIAWQDAQKAGRPELPEQPERPAGKRMIAARAQLPRTKQPRYVGSCVHHGVSLDRLMGSGRGICPTRRYNS